MELLQIFLWLLGSCCQLTVAAYIGINSNKNIPMKDDEFDRSLVPMIRLPRQHSMFIKPSISSYLNEAELTEQEDNKYTDNGLRPETDIRPIHSQSRKFADILKHQKAFNEDVKNNEVENTPMGANGLIAVHGETEEDRKKEFLAPNEGSCDIDGHKVINSEEIFQNDCGTLQCIDSEVTWSLKPLAKTLPHCEGIKSVPSMFSSYAKIKVVDDEQITGGKKSGPTRPDNDVVDRRKKIEEASRKMIEAEKWD